jgi:hypothetical protein
LAAAKNAVIMRKSKNHKSFEKVRRVDHGANLTRLTLIYLRNMRVSVNHE